MHGLVFLHLEGIELFWFWQYCLDDEMIWDLLDLLSWITQEATKTKEINETKDFKCPTSVRWNLSVVIKQGLFKIRSFSLFTFFLLCMWTCFDLNRGMNSNAATALVSVISDFCRAGLCGWTPSTLSSFCLSHSVKPADSLWLKGATKIRLKLHYHHLSGYNG